MPSQFVCTPRSPPRHDRRRFLGLGASALAMGGFGLSRSSADQTVAPGADVGRPSSCKPFTIKQISAGVLSVGYADIGPVDGPVVILLHGWPYDIHSFVEVAPALAVRGYRAIAPFVRGYGPTHFLASDTLRNGEPAALAVDIVDLMGALGIETATLAGFDWGARTANIIAALWPERCRALVSVSGYLISSPESGKAPLPPKAELAWWYQFTSRPSEDGLVMKSIGMNSAS